MKVIDQFVSNLYVGEPQEFEQLRVAPVFVREDRPFPYLDLEEALKRQVVEVTEVSEQGSVPSLRVTNTGDLDVIVLDGEELIGAKQNRIVNTTIIVPARSTVEIPVSCVEARRWGYTSRSFATSANPSYSSLRARKHSSVTASLRETGTHTSNQSEIWGDIAGKSSRLRSYSPTSSMSDMFDTTISPEADRQIVEQIPHSEGQVGYLAFVRGGFAGGDVFGSAELCRGKLRKFVRGHYLDALDEGVRFPAITVEEVIAQVRAAQQEQFATVGKGSEVRFEARDVQGTWKLVDDLIPHLLVLPKLN
ncbi:MAG TPA: DUF6569 family protein [Pyrinomonadaceae bacterium]